jgi:hypothetical protein
MDSAPVDGGRDEILPDAAVDGRDEAALWATMGRSGTTPLPVVYLTYVWALDDVAAASCVFKPSESAAAKSERNLALS